MPRYRGFAHVLEPPSVRVSLTVTSPAPGTKESPCFSRAAGNFPLHGQVCHFSLTIYLDTGQAALRVGVRQGGSDGLVAENHSGACDCHNPGPHGHRRARLGPGTTARGSPSPAVTAA